MKFAYFTDSHLRRKTPAARNDKDFLLTVINKLRYIFAWCQENGVKTVACAGDLGDFPTWSQHALAQFVQLRKEFSGIELIVVPGNHDVYAEDLSTYKNTAVGLLEDAYALSGIVYGGMAWRSSYIPVTFYGFGFEEPVTDLMLSGMFKPIDYDTDEKTVALVHATIGPEDAMGWKSIKKQNIEGFDVALFGDVHCGFDPHTFPGGTVAYSCGALVRLTRPEKDRPVRFAVVDLSDGVLINAITIPTETDCFTDVIDSAIVSCTNSIVETLKDVEVTESKSLEELVMEIGDKASIGKEAIDLVLGMIRHG